MRKHKTNFFGDTVDLDNKKTYSYLPDDCNKLDDLMFKEIGYALCYMNYFPSRKSLFPTKKRKPKFITHKGKKYDFNNPGYTQRQRVYKLIKSFSENRENHYNDALWYKEQIFLFQDETENMC